jgi:hypothetical protein
VAEDYAPFDIDVTTEEPPFPLGFLNGGGPGMRVVIGGSSRDWYGPSAGGLAYVGVFGYSDYQPAYVFTAQLGNGSPKATADAASHEGEDSECNALMHTKIGTQQAATANDGPAKAQCPYVSAQASLVWASVLPVFLCCC